MMTCIGGVLFAFIIAGTAYQIEHRDETLFWTYLKLALFLTSVAMIILYWILRRIVTRPLHDLILASERLGAGELGIQVPVPPLNETGKLTETFNIMSASLAEQRRALKASEEHYLSIFHFFPIPLILLDASGRMINVNSVYTTQAKSPFYLPDWKGKSVMEIPLVQKGGFPSEMKNLVEQSNPFKLRKIEVPVSDGHPPAIFNISGIPLFENEMKKSGAILAIEDITLQQNLEAQLIQSQKLESLGVLSGGIAHDFNNILTGILGYTQLLREQLPPGDFNQKALEVIERSSFRAKDLIQQMIGFARWHPLIKAGVEVNPLVSGVAALIGKSMGKEITIQTDLAPGTPRIFADADQIHQALLNLCINARDALPEGGGTIRLKTLIKTQTTETPPESPGKFIQIIIQDNGLGIDPEVLPHIFEPFFTTKEVGKGTGLGLSVTYGIVKANNGEISVQSKPGKGATFTLLFPLMEP